MGLRHCIGYLLAEHDELLKLAASIEKALESASGKDFSEHIKILAELRSLEHGLVGITEHCRAADRVVESRCYETFHQNELARINADHRQIIQAVASFREELKCATADRTMAMILPGMDVVRLLRAHVAYEGELFRRHSEATELREQAAAGKRGVSKATEKKRTHMPRQKTRKKEAGGMSYTMEPHPEL